MRKNRCIYFFYMAVMVVSGTFFVSCGNEEGTPSEMKGRGLTFKVNVEDFEAEPAASRSLQVHQPSVIDLGNGLVAEISVQPDTQPERPALQSRATLSDGRYKIYVLDASGARLSGAHKELNGTVSGGVFTPDANEYLLLENGTYTFVCINDAVTDNGTSLSISDLSVNPMIGVATKTLSQQNEVVTFTMKHQMARVRFQITSYTAPAVGAIINFYSDTGDWGGETFDLKGMSTGKINGGAFFKQNVPASVVNPVAYSPLVKPHTVITPSYFYLVEGFDTGYFWLNFSGGTLHGKNMADFTPILLNGMPQRTLVKKNHSYVINLRLKSKDPLHLYQDGTVGYLGDKGSRTPIGVVAKQKTETTEGIAVALKDAGDFPYNKDRFSSPTSWTSVNTTSYNDLSDVFNDMEGYKWTWDPAGSLDGRVKAQEAADYTQFHAAGNYSPGVAVTGTNVGKWYLPAMGEWAEAWKTIAGLILPKYEPYTDSATVPFDGTKFDAPFIAAGGEGFKGKAYVTSSEYFLLPFFHSFETDLNFHYAYRHYHSGIVRSFVHF